MKIADLVPKFKALVKKAGTKTLVACAAILVLGCVIALNFILSGGEEASDGGNNYVVGGDFNEPAEGNGN